MADTPTPQSLTPQISKRSVSWREYYTQHPVSRWSNEDIADWLVQCNLSHLQPVFIKFNGNALLSLTDRLIDELLSPNNSAVKELGAQFQVADKVNFKLHFNELLSNTPFIFQIYNFFCTSFTQLTGKFHTELINKISSKSAETIIKNLVLISSVHISAYIASSWLLDSDGPTKTKKR